MVWMHFSKSKSEAKSDLTKIVPKSPFPPDSRPPLCMVTMHASDLTVPCQTSWASLIAQSVKNPPAMQETLVQFLDWEDLLEKGKATHFSILA